MGIFSHDCPSDDVFPIVRRKGHGHKGHGRRSQKKVKSSLLQSSISDNQMLVKTFFQTQTTSSAIKAIDCTVNDAPLQVMTHNEMAKVRKLTPDTGKYSTVFTIPTDRTTPPFVKGSINSCAINPIDSILYCTLKMNQASGRKGEYIVRIDDANVEYIAKVPYKGNAAAISSTGVFYWSSTSGVWLLRNIAGKPSFSDAAQAEDLSDLAPYTSHGLSYPDDWVVLSGVDLDNSGDTAEYLIGLIRKKVIVHKATAAA